MSSEKIIVIDNIQNDIRFLNVKEYKNNSYKGIFMEETYINLLTLPPINHKYKLYPNPFQIPEIDIMNKELQKLNKRIKLNKKIKSNKKIK